MRPASWDLRPSGISGRAEEHLANYEQHILDRPTISDEQHDALLREFQALEGEHPDLVTPESPTERVGAPLSERFKPAG